MSTEHIEPVAQYGDDGHGAGSISAPAQLGEANGSQAPGGSGSSSRRRRRRRKGKGPGASAAGAPAAQGTGEDAGTVSAPAFVPGPVNPASQGNEQGSSGQQGQNPGQGQSQGQHSGQGQGGGKRKNRKRPGGGSGGSAPQPSNPGQNASQNGGGQNRNRQGRANGGWKARSSDGPDGNREGARGGFGSEVFSDNSNGARRKGKFGRGGSGGPRSFVGPMDHSYRTVNGNIADGSPSTMDYRNANGNANGNIHGRNDSMDAEPAAMLREDAPTRIICFIEDLFVVAKMQETARKLGVKVQFAKAEKEALAAIMDAPEGERPSLIVFDLNNAAAKPLTLIPKLKAKLKRGTSVIGFLQHIQGDLKLKAIEAGCDSVMPRSAFSQNLPNLLRRHGFAEEEEMMEV